MVDKEPRQEARATGPSRSSALPGATAEVAAFLVASVAEHPRDPVRAATERFGISRQAAHAALRKLIRQRRLKARGRTRARVYALGPVRLHTAEFHSPKGLSE